jgi:hypothetical protein
MTTPAYRFTNSSFKGNPEKAARRAEIRAYWLANPHALSRDVAAHFGITKDTASQYRPLAIKHLAIPNRQTTESTSKEIIRLHLLGTPPLDIAHGAHRSLSTVYRIIHLHQKKNPHEIHPRAD